MKLYCSFVSLAPIWLLLFSIFAVQAGQSNPSRSTNRTSEELIVATLFGDIYSDSKQQQQLRRDQVDEANELAKCAELT